jgi:predicted nucleic acid-binding protein
VKTVHVLDTSAVYELHYRHRPPFLLKLKAAKDVGDAILVPSMVLAEAEQAKQLTEKGLEAIFDKLALVLDLGKDIARSAAEALRSISRERCEKCSGFVRPSLVDAIVMASAQRYASLEDHRAIVHTGDLNDMELFRDHFPDVVVEKCS